MLKNKSAIELLHFTILSILSVIMIIFIFKIVDINKEKIKEKIKQHLSYLKTEEEFTYILNSKTFLLFNLYCLNRLNKETVESEIMNTLNDFTFFIDLNCKNGEKLKIGSIGSNFVCHNYNTLLYSLKVCLLSS